MSATDSMVTLQERMVNLIGQLTMPLLRLPCFATSYSGLLGSLNEYVGENGASINERVAQPWPIEENNVDQTNLLRC